MWRPRPFNNYGLIFQKSQKFLSATEDDIDDREKKNCFLKEFLILFLFSTYANGPSTCHEKQHTAWRIIKSLPSAKKRRRKLLKMIHLLKKSYLHNNVSEKSS